ncbi:N-acetylmannosamine-6-phosphate 2-epimerase [Paenibacillus lactis]|uniref:N-acetylmannosamine-6-phosphate 2-epimerase n=1 Tax=Paenibacillus lactis TaxID=228574 RepID=UPI0036AFA87B
MRRMITERGLVVSCQSYEGEPLFGPHHMAEMAKAAVLGGAIGIRANGTADIAAIKAVVNVPVIGLLKRRVGDCPVYITPTLEDACAVNAAGADIVAIDGTRRLRPDGTTIRQVVEELTRLGVCVMADVSTLEEGLHAAELGVRYISTTLSGYTPYSPGTNKPDIELVRCLAQETRLPVVAEGRFTSSEQMIQALNAGAQFVVVGSAITRPQDITERYRKAIEDKVVLNS